MTHFGYKNGIRIADVPAAISWIIVQNHPDSAVLAGEIDLNRPNRNEGVGSRTVIRAHFVSAEDFPESTDDDTAVQLVSANHGLDELEIR